MKKDDDVRGVAKRNANAEKEAIRRVIDALEALEQETQGRILRATAVLLDIVLIPALPASSQVRVNY
jgi:hypothetical protein